MVPRFFWRGGQSSSKWWLWVFWGGIYLKVTVPGPYGAMALHATSFAFRLHLSAVPQSHSRPLPTSCPLLPPCHCTGGGGFPLGFRLPGFPSGMTRLLVFGADLLSAGWLPTQWLHPSRIRHMASLSVRLPARPFMGEVPKAMSVSLESHPHQHLHLHPPPIVMTMIIMASTALPHLAYF